MVVAKEMAVRGLDYEERKVVAFSVDQGFRNGSIGNIEWELECGEYDDVIMIGGAIEENVESGTGWQLTYKRYSSI